MDARAITPRSAEFARRAELSVEIAERARRPTDPFVHGDGEAHACELYRQAVYWALLARAPSSGPDSGPLPSFEALWESAAPALQQAVPDAGARERLRTALVARTFADFAELGQGARVELAARLAAFVDELLSRVRNDRRWLARIRTLRLVRVGGFAFVVLALGVITLRTLAWQDERNDLARNATWSLSSNYGGGCRSPAQTCPESPAYFFHTGLELNPSIVFDLRRRRTVSRVTVENRLDCCTERAVPLVVELSNDQKQWRQVARRDEVFTTWRARFAASQARFVRVRLNGNGLLHLARVQILP